VTRAPTKATVAGRAYLAIQKKARAEARATDELLQLLALETFLDRLYTDGWVFATPTGEAIRDEDEYSGVRVTVPCALASARVRFHVDVNFGDPIWPPPREVSVPRLLGGTLSVRGYPLEMVHAEKIITALQRGTANTRWRDFADIYLLSRRHTVQAKELSTAIVRVAEFRRVAPTSLRDTLEGYAVLAQTRWAAWVRRQRLLDRLPMEFAEVLAEVQGFADPILMRQARNGSWDPIAKVWSGVS
jgi:hypothetical protein